MDLEWKIPNPLPEEEADEAPCYLAKRLLRKLQEGLGPCVLVHVMPGRMEMKCNFLPASYYLYKCKHRQASGTGCVFG